MVMNEEPLTLRETARGIGIRAAILGLGGLIVGGWVTAFALRVTGRLVQLSIGLILLLIGGGAATWEVRKLQRRLTNRQLPA